MKRTPAHGVVAALFASMTLVSVPAAADAPTVCNGEAGQTTVADLVIEPGTACYLTGTSITGDVTISRDASLVGEDVRIMGKITLQDNAFLDVRASDLVGDITAHDGLAFLADSTVLGSVTFTGSGENAPYFFSEKSTLRGVTRVQGSQVFIADSRVNTSLAATDGDYADIYDSDVTGRIVATGNRNGVTVCGSTTYTGVWLNNNGGVNVGPAGRDLCKGKNTFRTMLVTNGNTGVVSVSESRIWNALVGYGNESVPVVGENVTAGGAFGQYRGLLETPAKRRVVEGDGDNAEVDPATRGELLRARRAERRAVEVAKAKAAGPALGQ